MKQIIIVLALAVACFAQNGGVVPPPDIAHTDVVGAGQRAYNERTRANADAKLARQQAEVLKQQTEQLKLQNEALKKQLAGANNAWHIKDQSDTSVMIECAAGLHPEVFTKINIASIVCVKDQASEAPSTSK